MMFRAQTEGRCQVQRLLPKKRLKEYDKSQQDAEVWVKEWLVSAKEGKKEFGSSVRVKSYQFTWRIVSNSGQDEKVIRPVIGAGGWPFYPGASMKGAFRRVCTSLQALHYCGGDDGNGGTKPGILRFHGSYPYDNGWRDRLIDVVHPQEDWQVKKPVEEAKHSANILISLYKPNLVFGISSNVELSEEEWRTIWQLWEEAMERGLGSRVSAGYGQGKIHGLASLIKVNLKGQGLASHLIDGTEEFRVNMFKAALRGHTLRLFGGVCEQEVAEDLTKEIWGGFAGNRGAVVGLLGTAFDALELNFDTRFYKSDNLDVYYLDEGSLHILLMKSVSEKKRKNLGSLTLNLIKFSLLLGGFGKSWRRADQTYFHSHPDSKNKYAIGCHWELLGKSERFYIPVNQLGDTTRFLANLQSSILQPWVRSRRKATSDRGSGWREAWHPDNVQVWGRIAESRFDCQAIPWFHGPYSGERSIKGTELTGWLNQVGRIWHRMYPRYTKFQGGKMEKTGEYVELLTLFPDNADTTVEFCQFLEKETDFQRLWGEEVN